MALEQARKEARSWWLPALLLIVAATLAIWIAAPYQVEVTNRRSLQMIERLADRLPEEQVAAMRDSVRPITLGTYLVTGIGGAVVIMALGWLARAVIIHLSSLAAGNTGTWGATFAVTIWSMIPLAMRDLVQAVYVGVYRQMIEHQGISFLVASGDWMRDGQNLLYITLSRIDPFVIWHTVLLGLGIAMLTQTGRAKGILWAAVLWALFTALNLIPTAITIALSGGLMG